MNRVVTLRPDESARLDSGRLSALYQELGHAGAEDVVCRTIEELALRLSHCEQMWRRTDWIGLRKSARSLIGMSEQIGMTTLAQVAGDVTRTIDSGDRPALAATLTRLVRIGERSLMAVWDLQDLSV